MRQFGTDPDFVDEFTIEGITWGSPGSNPDQARKRFHWERTRKDFIRFYSLRAGAFGSKGSHDEWNILRHLNEKRARLMPGGIGDRIAAFYDGHQVDLAALVTAVPRGYQLE